MTAVVKGADDSSPRWRHALLIGALLQALEEKKPNNVPFSLRNKLQGALVRATNLALEDGQGDPHSVANRAIVFLLNQSFRLLPESERWHINYALLLPVLVETVFSSNEGLEHGYWLGIIDQDVREVRGKKFAWSANSPTFQLVQTMANRPLVTSLGPICRLIGHAVERIQDPNILISILGRLSQFARTIAVSWRQNKLSEIDASEATNFLDAESIQTTTPALWHILKLSLYAVIIILRSITGRLLTDAALGSDAHAPFVAIQALHLLRNMYFIASPMGQTSTQPYAFVNMVALDILSRYPEQTQAFLQEIAPPSQGQISAHPIDRNLDLFFLNTAEHLVPILPPEFNQNVVLAAAVPYMKVQGSASLKEIFEAAHSATLSVLIAPQNEELVSLQIPFYIETLLSSFPGLLSSRQFRLAFRTLIRITSPPSMVAKTQPYLAAILLETVMQRAHDLSQSPVPTAKPTPDITNEETISDQAHLLMALIDSLCFLTPTLLEEWLPLTATAISYVEDSETRTLCYDRLWEAISGGEMDVERAALCVEWWSSNTIEKQIMQNGHVSQHSFPNPEAIVSSNK